MFRTIEKMKIVSYPFMAMSFFCLVSTRKDPYKPIIRAFILLFGLFFKCAAKSFNGTESNVGKVIYNGKSYEKA